jgi:hypothetical protein
MKCHLQDIALDICKQCLNYNLSLDVEWIPRTENERADFFSRIVDFDDWSTGISEDLFLYVDSLWEPHEIDWFANDDNHKLLVFYSRYWNVKSIGIDAFNVDWGEINGLFVPPVCLLFRFTDSLFLLNHNTYRYRDVKICTLFTIYTDWL